MEEFLTSNATLYRLLRSIAQGIIGVLIANIDLLIDKIPSIDPTLKPIIAALVMCILSPIMSELGKHNDR